MGPSYGRYFNTIVVWVCLVVGLFWIAARLTRNIDPGTTAPPVHRAGIVKTAHGKQAGHHKK